MLALYAQRLPTVEINYTFRAMPRRQMLEGWAGQTPPGFRFALKAPQRVTHIARLRNVAADVDHFIETASALGERLGPILFQLPPGMKQDLPLLRDFVAPIQGRIMAAFEFRNDSWFDDAVMAALADAGCALCIAESDTLATPVLRTAAYAYLRLRREEYGEADLRLWADRIAELGRGGADVYAYLKHELKAPALAEQLTALVEARVA